MTVAIKTFGCRLNRAETAAFAAGFERAGFARVPFGAPARVAVLHTCAVTQAAEQECLKVARALRRRDPEVCIVLAGCAVEAAPADALRALGADLVVPRERKDELVACVLRHLGVEPPPPSPASELPLFSTQRAALKVQDGCDFRCAYCIVPHTRGAPRSRPLEACLEEASRLVGAGFRELVVTGCNLACYADGSRGLTQLLAALAALPGLGRLRLGSLEPGTLEREVLALMAATPKLCRFLHLPLQSGDSGVLARMRRRYTAAQLDDTLREAERLLPGLGLGADLIAGFPGESEEAFGRTLALVESHPFSNLHVFPYSERPGTPAAEFPDAIPLPERERRAQLLRRAAAAKRAAFARHFVGTRVEVLVERYDARGAACGWTSEYLACALAGAPLGLKRQLIACTPHAVDACGVLQAHA